MKYQNASSICPTDALPGSDQVLGVGRRADPCQVGHGLQEHNRASRHTEGFEGVEKDVGEVGKRGILQAENMEAFTLPAGGERCRK